MANPIKKITWRLGSPKMPVVRLANNAKTIEFMGYLKKRENSLIDPWHQLGYEIRSGPVEIIINGKRELGYCVDEAGITVEFHRDITVQAPINITPDTPGADPFKEIDDLLIPKWGKIWYHFEGVIGRAATLDDIADGLDLGKSLKNTVIGLLMGIPVGWILTVSMQ